MMSHWISPDPGPTRAYTGHRVSFEWQSAHFVTSTAFASPGIFAPCSSVPSPSAGSTRGLPNGCRYPNPYPIPITATTVTTATTQGRTRHSPPVSNRRQPDDCVPEQPSPSPLPARPPVFQPEPSLT